MKLLITIENQLDHAKVMISEQNKQVEYLRKSLAKNAKTIDSTDLKKYADQMNKIEFQLAKWNAKLETLTILYNLPAIDYMS